MSHPHPELDTPPPLPDGGLRIIPLGGLGEIGRNMTVFEHAGRLLIVDCGVLFPEPDQPGVDLILPDFGYLAGRLGQVEALVLTHAHEDHIGAVPYLLRERADIPLAGSKLTLGLIRSKLTEHRITQLEPGVRISAHAGGFPVFTSSLRQSDFPPASIRPESFGSRMKGAMKFAALPASGRFW